MSMNPNARVSVHARGRRFFTRLANARTLPIGKSLQRLPPPQKHQLEYVSLVARTIVWATGADGRFVVPQPSWGEYTGQTWEEQKGLGWIEMIHPTDRGHIMAIWSGELPERTTYQSEGRVWHAATREYHRFVARIVPLVYSSGSVSEWVCTLIDVEELSAVSKLALSLWEPDRRLQHPPNAPSPPPMHRGGLPPGRLRRVIDYIQGHLSGDISLTHLADVAKMSPFHFAHVFKESTGISPHQYVLQERVEKAKLLLSGNRLSLAEIGYALGFPSQSHFTTIFRKKVGTTPGAFRAGG